jgi:HD-GYP domain-containing protein (c-di-GMP phosphodiesterase class II)
MLGMSEEALKSIHRGTLLHDIGKVGVPVRILDKPGRLTGEERTIIEKHVEVGQHILEPIPSYHDLVPLVRHHHECFDGTGYPDGLAGEDIDFRARILAVADCFDALTHDRPYRKSLGRESAVAWIWQMAGKKFDPTVVDAFLLIVNQEEKESADNMAPPSVIEAGLDDVHDESVPMENASIHP